jgi:hypothetical protein
MPDVRRHMGMTLGKTAVGGRELVAIMLRGGQ